MTNCKTCPVSTGTHKPAEALHQQIAEPQPEALRLADALTVPECTLEYGDCMKAGELLRAQHARISELEAQHLEELRAYEITVANREARIAELEDALQFVERWAVHHGGKPSISAQEALSCIQHYPAIHEITKSYKDGKRPDTFNPYARIAELESQLEAIGAGGVEPLRKQAAQAVHQIAEPAAPVGKPIKDAIDALVMAAFTEGGCSEHRMSEARIQTELRKKELCTLIAATQPAAQGMEALPMQASEGVEDVAVMEHPEWMLVHKETGAQKPQDSQWTVRAAQPAAQGAATTGYIAPKGRYVPPVLFSPYTGEPRDARDIASDPRGILIVPPGAALAAQAKQGGAA